MKNSVQYYSARFTAQALAGLAIATAVPAAATSTKQEPSTPMTNSSSDSEPTSPQSPPLADDIDVSTLSVYSADLLQTRPEAELVLLPRDTALTLSSGAADTPSGCPVNLDRLRHGTGVRTDAMLYEEQSVAASEHLNAPVCVYFVTSHRQEQHRIIRGRRLASEAGDVRADLVSRTDWLEI